VCHPVNRLKQRQDEEEVLAGEEEEEEEAEVKVTKLNFLPCASIAAIICCFSAGCTRRYVCCLQESSEYETDSEDELHGRQLLKPVFVPKSERETITERELMEKAEEDLLENEKRRLEERKVCCWRSQFFGVLVQVALGLWKACYYIVFYSVCLDEQHLHAELCRRSSNILLMPVSDLGL
jgi:Microfibril-associated/Pre-mRNA processing